MCTGDFFNTPSQVVIGTAPSGYFSCRFVQSMMPPLVPFGMGVPKTHAFLKTYLFSMETWRDVVPGHDGHDSALAGATIGKRRPSL